MAKDRISGAVLVDGHHVYLECLQDILAFNRFFAGDGALSADDRRVSEQLRAMLPKNPFTEIKGHHIARYAMEILSDGISQMLVAAFRQKFGGKDIWDVFERRTQGGEPEDPYELSTLLHHSFVTVELFDAENPPAARLRTRIQDALDRAAASKRRDSEQVRHRLHTKLADLDRGQQVFRINHTDVRAPWDAKNDYIREMADQDKYTNLRRLHLGIRKYTVQDTGNITTAEKMVDTRLVLRGADLADNPSVDFVLLVSNDADYVPLVERLQDRGKFVGLLCVRENPYVSGDLIGKVRETGLVMMKDDLLNPPIRPSQRDYQLDPSVATLLSMAAIDHLVQNHLPPGFDGLIDSL